mgnify:CR=1 FL=1
MVVQRRNLHTWHTHYYPYYFLSMLGRSGPVSNELHCCEVHCCEVVIITFTHLSRHSHSAENISANLALVFSKKQRYMIRPHWPHLFQFCSMFRLFLYLPVPPFFSFSILVLIVALDYQVESF